MKRENSADSEFVACYCCCPCLPLVDDTIQLLLGKRGEKTGFDKGRDTMCASWALALEKEGRRATLECMKLRFSYEASLSGLLHTIRLFYTLSLLYSEGISTIHMEGLFFFLTTSYGYCKGVGKKGDKGGVGKEIPFLFILLRYHLLLFSIQKTRTDATKSWLVIQVPARIRSYVSTYVLTYSTSPKATSTAHGRHVTIRPPSLREGLCFPA